MGRRMILYARMAATAPTIGPTMYTQRLSKFAAAMAGPSDRAGFIDAPEIGLPVQNHLTNQHPGAKLLEFDITLKRSDTIDQTICITRMGQPL